MVRIQRLMPSPYGCDDYVWIGGPCEGLRLGIMLADEAVDGGLEIDGGMEDAAFEPPLRELGKEAFNCVEPGAGCWHEVECPAGVAVEPSAHLRVLVCGVVVEDRVDLFVDRDSGLDGVEEADELLMAVTLHVTADDGAVEDIQRGEEGRGAVPLIVVGHRAGAALLHG